MIATTTGAEEKNKLSAGAEQFCRQFSLAEIQLATGDFSDAHLIGKGGFGKVYKGPIPMDKGKLTMAIKRLVPNSNQGAHEFFMEIETLSKLRHVNLVSLIGYCNENEEMILVYDYIARGTLADHLYKLSRNSDSDGCSELSWKQRLKTCIGAGRGLDYLHTGSSIIHRDVKSTNILVDENFIAKVSDFGLAKYFSTSNTQSHVSTVVKGSFGYLDPSYYTTGRLTTKSDTYAFGVVLLEVLCGRPAVDPRLGEDEMSLVLWAQEKIRKGKVDLIVASNLRDEISADCLKEFVGVVKRCLHHEPKKWPTMAQAVVQLEFALEQQEREAPTLDVSRFLPLNALWNRVKPSGTRATGSTQKDHKQVDVNTPTTSTQEDVLKDKLFVGQQVKVKNSVKRPRFGWSGHNHESIGTISVIDADGRLRIYTRPGSKLWVLDPSEVEIVEERELHVNDWVRVKKSVTSPTYKWGEVLHTSVGVVHLVKGKDLWVAFCFRDVLWRCKGCEMEWVRPFKVGDKVKMREGLENPRWGWGRATCASKGEVVEVNYYGRLSIKFSLYEERPWYGDPAEIVHDGS